VRALLRTGTALAFGLVVGAAAMVGLQQAPAELPEPRPPAPSPAKQAPAPVPEEAVLLVWTPGGLPDGLAEAVAALPRVEAVTAVRGGLAELTTERGGWVIPLDVIAVDPATYAAFVPKSAAADFAALTPGSALLGSTSARLRDSDRLDLADGTALAVAGTVDDTLVGAAEVVVANATLPDLPPRYLLLRHRGERAPMEEAIRAAAPPGTPLRVRGPGETPYLRHGDAVLPQAIVKERFGEFSYRRGQGRELTQDPAWARAHIVTGDVPLLGRITCHRAVMDAVHGALGELAERGLGWLVEPEGYAGCYSPRLTSSLDSVSRHAWGIALDVNEHKNPYGQTGAQDPRLVEAFERWGFTWGGEWLIPDPAHFELVRPPGR
jgi:hypothetical protein